MELDESIRDQALELVELAHNLPNAEHIEAVEAFRVRSPQHEQAIVWATKYLHALPLVQPATFSHTQQLQIKMEAWWARLWAREQIAGSVLTIMFASVVVWGSWQFFFSGSESSADFQTLIAAEDRYTTSAHHREVSLSDGTTMWLDWRSDLSVRFTDGNREIRLDSGRAAFAVTKDVARPFTVTSNGVTTTVTGTEFIVSTHGPDTVEVEVLEGSVNVATVSGQVSLAENQIARVQSEHLQVSENHDKSQHAWRTGKIVLRNVSMMDALQRLQPYTFYDIDMSRLEHFPAYVSGTYFTERSSDALITLIETHELQVEQNGRQLILSPPNLVRPGRP